MNDWQLIDDDSSQYVKQNSDTEFSLIELSLINPETKEFEVYADTIDTEDYLETMRGELEAILDSFGYISIEDVANQYGEADQVIAECIFEYYGSFQAEQLFIGKREECEIYIKEYIKRMK